MVRQLMWVALGAAAMLVTMRVDYRWLQSRLLTWILVAGTTVALVAALFSPRTNNTHRWLGYGGLGIQPSEFAKLVVIPFMALALGRRLEDDAPLEPELMRIGAVLVVFGVLILEEPDMGNTVMLMAIALTMLFVAGLAYKWVLVTPVAAVPMLYLMAWLAPYRFRRLTSFLEPQADPLGANWQVTQSLYAVGSGGLWGRGFMQGVQKLFYLPEAHSDFIYAVIAEEKGLVGATFVLACFALIIWRGVLVARRAPDAFGCLVASGITVLIGLQGLVNLSVVLKMLPAKGIALPFVSAGGSSMVVSLVAMGVLLNVSQRASATELET